MNGIRVFWEVSETVEDGPWFVLHLYLIGPLSKKGEVYRYNIQEEP